MFIDFLSGIIDSVLLTKKLYYEKNMMKISSQQHIIAAICH
ncbi:hypothetical protein A45J_2284 [hot springs metagenome]|uniref:Uncharacterized protein n=1 Tax=hot springs metagenome TaxID=433727 RepID=A0A5J4L6M0_9ZZZZ